MDKLKDLARRFMAVRVPRDRVVFACAAMFAASVALAAIATWAIGAITGVEA